MLIDDLLRYLVDHQGRTFIWWWARRRPSEFTVS